MQIYKVGGEKMESILYGRELLFNELPVEIKEKIETKKLKVDGKESFLEKNGQIICRRCQHEMFKVKEGECRCREACAYCRNCLKMGKVSKCTPFYFLPEENRFNERNSKLLAWKEELSEQQQEASNRMIDTIEKKERRLLWAVAGAGKTEMLFPGIEKALTNNERVCIASPRVDVCLELAPRIREAFPTIPLAVLYGKMDKEYEYTQLTIATTHQLFRFKEAFDLLIIDEIDAFPFEMDESLQFAADKARKKQSSLIYLSATPNQKMQKEVARGRLQATILPARYHGYELPVPKTKWCVNWKETVLNKFRRTSFGKACHQRIKVGKRFLVFVPNIKWMLELEKLLRSLYPTIKFESVSSEDPQRKKKVLMMREFNVQFLITTTILERGVTFPNIDVLVLGAENQTYTESALVQIAGRCGRASDYPTGDVFFFHNGKTIAIKRAINQINKMNRLAKEKGLIR